MASELSGESGGAGDLSRWRFVAGMLVWVGLASGSVWLLQGWLERRFGLPDGVVWPVASLPGSVLGLLLARRFARTGLGADPEQQRRRDEKGRRRVRAWMIAALWCLLLGQLGRCVAAFYGVAPDRDEWSFPVIVILFVAMGLMDLLSSPADARPDAAHLERAAQCEALRVGYLVLGVSGVVAGLVAVRLPWVAGQAWAPVLLASVLAAETRMAMLLRRTAQRAGELV